MKKHNWYSFLAAGLILMLLPVSVVACGSQTGTPDAGDVPSVDTTPPIAKEYADFEIGSLAIQRSGVSVGETATVSTTVTNTGDVSGTYEAVLLIDGKEADRKEAFVGPKVTESVAFQVTQNAPGSYKLAIGDSAATLSVYEWPYTIQYDLDDVQNELLSVSGEYGHIVRFSPPAIPFRVQKITVYGQGRVNQESEWRDKYITMRIWDENATRQVWSEDFPWHVFWSETGNLWKDFDVPNVSVNGDFYVEIITHSDQFGEEIVAWPWSGDVRPAIFLGWDRPNPNIDAPGMPLETRSGISEMGALLEIPTKYQGLNWLVRVEGSGEL